MPIISYNYDWMVYNAFLAMIAVLSGFIFLWLENKYIKIIPGLVWILFLPNTLYIFTDLVHLMHQWNEVDVSLHPVLLLQYLLFELVGVVTFLFGFLPFEQMVSHVRFLKKKKITVFIACNFLIAFGMVLGRVERINSWDIFFVPGKVFNSALRVVTSVDLLALTLLFGLLCNFVYFLFRTILLQRMGKYFHVSD